MRLTDPCVASRLDLPIADYVMLAITDSGHGMEPDVVERAFEPFYTTKSVGSGSGLGLSMVRGFVTQSSGHIDIKSTPGVGTTARIYLPRHEGRPQSAATEKSRDAIPEEASGEVVLVVEDNGDLRRLVIRLLDYLGYKGLEAATATEALERLRRGDEVDLLLTDMVLPGEMDGAALYERAEALRPGLPVLFMSGSSEPKSIGQGRVGEDYPLVRKPFRRLELAEAVSLALEMFRHKG